MQPESRPRSNRVTPEGKIEATPYRGSLMGNRGRLGPGGWITTAWIACDLDYEPKRNRERRYTPLFFHDEAVALTAGFRPCALCRRDAYRNFKDAFCQGHGRRSARSFEMDRALRSQRIVQTVRLRDLPDGAFVRAPDGQRPLLWWEGGTYVWSHAGYHAAAEQQAAAFTLITPPAVVRVFQAGYRPMVRLGDGSVEPGFMPASSRGPEAAQPQRRVAGHRVAMRRRAP